MCSIWYSYLKYSVTESLSLVLEILSYKYAYFDFKYKYVFKNGLNLRSCVVHIECTFVF